MRLRSLDTEQQVSKPLLSCAKSSAASQGFFLWESPLQRISPSKRLLLSLCSQGCSCCTPHETQQLAPPTRGCWSWLLSREYGWAGSILSGVTPIPPSHTQCSGTLGKVGQAGRRWKFGSAPARTGKRGSCRTRGKVRGDKSMARQPGCSTGSSEEAFSKQCCMCPVKPSHHWPQEESVG